MSRRGKINKYKAINDLKDSINILEANTKLFHEGNVSVYRVIATQLRLLLCDRDPLIQRLFGNVMLYPVVGRITKEEEEECKRRFGFSIRDYLAFQMPGRVHFDQKKGPKIETLFDERKPPIPLKEWLDQCLFNIDITIRQLIKSVANKEGAHSDKEYDKTLKFTKSVKLVNQDIHIKFIVAIGEYILKWLKRASEQLHP